MKEAAKHKNVGEGSKTKISQRRELLALTHKYKLKDNNLFGNKLRRKKNWLRGTLERLQFSFTAELHLHISNLAYKPFLQKSQTDSASVTLSCE